MARKCFLSYHAEDKAEVDKFCSDFEGDFIRRGSDMDEDIIDSTDSDYVMRRIREKFLKDSTVTIVLIGACTWARRYIDWETQASLRKPADGSPNGLVAIQLNSSGRMPPERVKLNRESGYAKFYKYPSSSAELNVMIEEAFEARTKFADKIVNPREKFKNNRTCP